VAPADADVPRVIDQVLIAAEGVGFGQSWSATRDKRERLVVAEARKCAVGIGKGLVEANIELGFVQLADRLADVVVSGAGVTAWDKC
jgi:hypothetical protein